MTAFVAAAELRSAESCPVCSAGWSPDAIDELDDWLRCVLRSRFRLAAQELDDLVQETWLAAIRTCVALPPRAWFYVTAVRRQRRVATRSSALRAALDESELSGVCAPVTLEPERCCERRELLDRARSTLAGLQRSERDLFARHALGEESLQGAARRLGRSRKWARLALLRAERELRAGLRDWRR